MMMSVPLTSPAPLPLLLLSLHVARWLMLMFVLFFYSKSRSVISNVRHTLWWMLLKTPLLSL